MGGDRDCYEVSLIEATRSPDRLSTTLAVERSGPLPRACSDIGAPYPYEVAVAFTEPPIPERVEVRHGDETVVEAEL